MNKSIFITNILLHVGLMAVFLTIFFFTFAQNIEKQIVEEQINFVITDIVGNVFQPLNKEQKKCIKCEINKEFKTLDFNKEDSEVKKSNKQVFDKALIFVGILFVIVLIFVIIMGFVNKWDHHYIKYLITASVSSLIFVAITETLFLLLIAKNYLSADPNKIQLKIIKTLEKDRPSPAPSAPSSSADNIISPSPSSCETCSWP